MMFSSHVNLTALAITQREESAGAGLQGKLLSDVGGYRSSTTSRVQNAELSSVRAVHVS